MSFQVKYEHLKLHLLRMNHMFLHAEVTMVFNSALKNSYHMTPSGSGMPRLS